VIKFHFLNEVTLSDSNIHIWQNLSLCENIDKLGDYCITHTIFYVLISAPMVVVALLYSNRLVNTILYTPGPPLYLLLFLRYLFSTNFCHRGKGGTAVDPPIHTGLL
jgi:hypothetical protein